MLSSSATNTKRPSQALLGSLDVAVERNHFGTQLQSFQQPLSVENIAQIPAADPFHAVFIRAPVITSCGDGVNVIAHVDTPQGKAIVGVRQGLTIGTAFHPELTRDDRFHRYFLALVEEYKAGKAAN